MKAIILNGSQANDNMGERVNKALTEILYTQGWDVEQIILIEKKIGNCAGDFFCWVRTPGICNVDDDNRAIADSISNSDLLVYLTPITFGGYSSTLKRMVDHQIQNVSPFFTKIDGETHHHKRYQKNPDFLAVGWLDTPDARAEALFQNLVQRNALNFYAKNYISGLAFTSQTDGELLASARIWLDELQNGRSSSPVKLSLNGDPLTEMRTGTGIDPLEVKRALLLVGSPKTHKSTSNSLGEYLFDHLGAQSIEIETIYLYTVLRNFHKMQALLDAIDTADLIMLAFPIYVDTLPAPVIEALERIMSHRMAHGEFHRQLFSAIANCGFPEVHHCANSLALCENFALQAGFEWAGSLALGAGEMINGTSLVEAGGMAIRIRQSLELAAGSLAQGQVVPQAAQDLMSKPVIPHALYRLSGWWRWNQMSQHYGVRKSIKRQPYLAKTR